MITASSCCCPSATRRALVLSAVLCESSRNWSIVERGTLRANESALALAGWWAFDRPSSAAGLSDRRICAGGLAGLVTGWPDLPRFASGSTDQPMWRTIDRAIADSSRDFCPFCATPAAPPGAAANRREGYQRARLSGFQPVLLRQNPDGERPAFWKTGFISEHYSVPLPWPLGSSARTAAHITASL